MFKTFVLLYALFVPMTDKADWNPVVENITGDQCNAHISELLIQNNINYRTMIMNDRNVVHAVDRMKVLDAPSILLTCYDTSEKLYVNSK